MTNRSTMSAVTMSVSTPAVADLEAYRRELTAHCYRMLGSGSEAEDAVQETMVRAWQGAERFEGRASVKTWLYRIATHVCIDMSRSPQRRARPIDLGPARTPDPVHLADVLPDGAWITPIADSAVIDLGADPADVAAARDTIRLAFVERAPAAPRHAASGARALRRAPVAGEGGRRAARHVDGIGQQLAAACPGDARPGADIGPDDPTQRRRSATPRPIRRRLRALRHGRPRRPAARRRRADDAAVRDVAAGSQRSHHLVFGSRHRCTGSRLLAGHANGCPAFAQYRQDPNGGHVPWALQVVELRGNRIEAIHAFLDTEVFERFGFPPRLN